MESKLLLHSPVGISVAEVDASKQRVAEDLLNENHRKHHIFFNDQHFHNHVTHHILAAYSLGAKEERLKEIYEDHKIILRDKRPSKFDINEDNWTQFQGDENAYTDYERFFENEVKKLGIEAALRKYAFDRSMLTRLMSGIFHPIIHLGYGVEFQDPLMVAEGLGMDAVHPDGFAKFRDAVNQTPPKSEMTIMQIFEEIRSDPRFKGYGDVDAKKVGEERYEAVVEMADQWFISNDEEVLAAKTKEYYHLIVLLYAAVAQRPDKEGAVRLSFVLMHALTSMYFLEAFMHSAQEYRLPLFRAHLFASICSYIAEECPELHVDLLKNYKNNEPKEWSEILNRAVAGEDEHALKVIRSLYKAQQLYGDPESIYFNAARLTMDNVHYVTDWSFAPLGKDDEWKGRGVVRYANKAMLQLIDAATGIRVEDLQIGTLKIVDRVKHLVSL